jgi:proteasome lid subunit RPN8/RPN11
VELSGRSFKLTGHDGEPRSPSSEEIAWQESPDVFEPAVVPLETFLATVRLRSVLEEVREPLIFFADVKLTDLLRDCRRDVRREHGGILLGQVFRDPGGRYFVVVRATVLAPKTEGSPVHLQFTEDSWSSMWTEMGKFSELMLVGWYHTHPGLGVFLSGTDRRTQALYFAQPWHVAIVIDPVKDEIGFFWGRDGRKARDVVTFQDADAAEISSLA